MIKKGVALVIIFQLCNFIFFNLVFAMEQNRQKLKYTLFIDGIKSGYEEATIEKHQENITVKNDIKYTLKVNDENQMSRIKSSLFWMRSDEGNRYHINGTIGSQVIDIEFTFKNQSVLVMGKEIPFEGKEYFVLDNLVFSHYQLLLDKVINRSDTDLRFHVFIPQIGSFVPATIKLESANQFEVGGKVKELKKYHLIIGSTLAEIYTDLNNIVQGIVIPSQKIESYLNGNIIQRLSPSKCCDAIDETALYKEEIEFFCDEEQLSGEFIGPQDRTKIYPTIIFITGSGTQDRDGKNAAGTLDLKSKELSYFLSSKGYNVLRWDDRAMDGEKNEKKPITFESDLRDSSSAFSYLVSRKDVDSKQVFIIGHSSGALIAAMLSNMHPSISGIILMAMPAKRLDETIIWQLNILFDQNNLGHPEREMALEHQMRFFEFVKKYELGMPIPDIYKQHERSLLWLKSIFAVSPIDTAKGVKCPVLILQGKKDLQVSYQDAEIIYKTLKKDLNDQVELTLFDTLDHLFMHSEDGNIAHYYEHSRKLDQAFLNRIAEWLNKHIQE